MFAVASLIGAVTIAFVPFFSNFQASNPPSCESGQGFAAGHLNLGIACGAPPPSELIDGANDANLVAIDPMKPLIPCDQGDLARCEFIVNAAPDDPPVGVAPITIADLASFTPAVGELVVQPENWGVLGIPTNFVATATDQIQEGTLLEQPVEVRWRPVGFTFDYGDGTVVTTSDPGAMWSSSDDDWTTTSTSHEYEERGEYTATVTITFEADISTAAGWATVPGTLELAAPAEGVRIFEVQTVLTRGDCIEYPNDPGCAP